MVEKRKYDVISVGSATLDIFVKSSQFKVVENKGFPSGLALCEAYGGKIEVEDVHMASGGGATNTAVSFARKGLKVACIAEMGKDLAARTILHDLEEEGVDTSMMVQEVDEATAVSVIMIAPEGGRSIVTCRGAAAMLEIKDIYWNALETKWLYITSLGGRMELLKKLVEFANEKRIKVAMNPGVKELQEVKRLREICCQVEVLIMNMEESKHYLGDENLSEAEVGDRLKSEGGSITLITNGDKGAQVVIEDKVCDVEAAIGPVIEATGAGDAFGSGFVAGQILGYDMEKSIELARANAGGVIGKFGAKAGLVGINKLTNFNNKNKIYGILD
jgi:ribokinase